MPDLEQVLTLVFDPILEQVLALVFDPILVPAQEIFAPKFLTRA